MKKYAVLVVDVLNDFVTGPIAGDNAKTVIQPIARLTEEARKNNVPVIYTNDAHVKGVDKEFEVWGEHALAGSKGAQVITELTPQDGDLVVHKRRYSGVFQTDLDLLLRELDVDTVIVTGLYAHLCCRQTCADAFNLGYGLVVPEETMAALEISGFPNNDIQLGLAYFKDCFGAQIPTLEEAIKMIQK